MVITAVVLFCLAVAFVLFNRNGVLALMRMRRQREDIELQIDSLTAEVESLRTEIRMLRSDSLYMERKVREILGWGRPGEFVVRFLDGMEN
jgi:cell division protein FtsB